MDRALKVPRAVFVNGSESIFDHGVAPSFCGPRGPFNDAKEAFLKEESHNDEDGPAAPGSRSGQIGRGLQSH